MADRKLSVSDFIGNAPFPVDHTETDYWHTDTIAQNDPYRISVCVQLKTKEVVFVVERLRVRGYERIEGKFNELKDAIELYNQKLGQ